MNIASVGILENTFESNLNVYPNPTSGKIFIEFSEGQNASVSLMNVSGEVIQRKTFSETSIITYEVDQPVGVYFLEITNADNEKAVIRVIKH